MKIDWRGIADRLLYRNSAPVKYRSKYGALGGNNGAVDSLTASSTQYAILRLLSQSVAQVDWRLYRKSTDGRRVYGEQEDNRREILRHQALNVLNKPNPLMHRQLFFERSDLMLEQEGEVFWVVEKVGGIPLEMWPVYPKRMFEVLNDSGELIGWKYREPDGTYTGLELDKVIHVQTPDPSNMFRGVGPTAAIMPDLESFRAAGEYNRNFFRNSAIPGGFYEVPNTMQDHEFEQFLDRQREMHRGVGNAHRVGLLENGIKFVQSGITHKDMDFVELRSQSRDVIREVYGIHKHMLGQSDDVNRANAVAASIDFAHWQVTPRLERFKAALNYSFLPMFGSTSGEVEFCYDNPVPEDPEQEVADRDSRVKAATALIAAGFDPEETLAAYGLPPIKFIGVKQPVAAEDPYEEPVLEGVA